MKNSEQLYSTEVFKGSIGSIQVHLFEYLSFLKNMALTPNMTELSLYKYLDLKIEE